MPDRVTPTRWRVALGQAFGTVVLFALVGAGCGWLWWSLWAPAPDGVVSEGRWFPLSGSQTAAADFAGTGLYVVVAIVAGLALGLLVAASRSTMPRSPRWPRWWSAAPWPPA